MIKTIAIAITLGLTLLPLSGHLAIKFKDEPVVSTGENRNLADWPQWSESGQTPVTYFRNIDGYLNDNFGGRAYAIITHSIIKRVFNDPSAKAVRGRTDDWLFNGSFQIWQAYMGQDGFTAEDVDLWLMGLAQLKDTAQKNGAVFAAIIPPTKSRIYPEHVTRRYGAPSARRFADALYQDERSNALGLIHIDPLMMTAKKTGAVFYKTDTHWTYHGAYQAYRAVMAAYNQARRDYPVVKANDRIATNHEVFSGDLARLLGLEGVLTENLTEFTAPPNVIPFIHTKLDDDTITSDGYQTLIFEKDGETGDTVLIIGDSFSGALEPFFMHSFSKIVFVHHRDGEFDLSAAMSYAPDAVLFAPSELHARRMRRFGK